MRAPRTTSRSFARAARARAPRPQARRPASSSGPSRANTSVGTDSIPASWTKAARIASSVRLRSSGSWRTTRAITWATVRLWQATKRAGCCAGRRGRADTSANVAASLDQGHCTASAGVTSDGIARIAEQPAGESGDGRENPQNCRGRGIQAERGGARIGDAADANGGAGGDDCG